MSGYIFAKLADGVFEISWEFLFNNSYKNIYATWDTGCGTTMVSYNLLIKKEQIANEERIRYKKEALLSKSARLSVGYGIESFDINSMEKGLVIQEIVDRYNNNPESINEEEFDALIEYEGLYFDYNVTKVRMAGYCYKDTTVSISYDYDNVALIGMEIIKDFYSIIGTKGNKTFLFACFRYIDGLQKVFLQAQEAFDLISDDDEIIDFANTHTSTIPKLTKEDVCANYINSLLNKIDDKTNSN